jgi:hypothetical protein
MRPTVECLLFFGGPDHEHTIKIPIA